MVMKPSAKGHTKKSLTDEKAPCEMREDICRRYDEELTHKHIKNAYSSASNTRQQRNKNVQRTEWHFFHIRHTDGQKTHEKDAQNF